MNLIRSMSRFWTENGAYLFGLRLAEAPFNWIRNRMLAAMFGVQRIQIGRGGFLRGLCAIQMGENFAAGPGLWLEAVLRHNGQTFTPRIVIGRNVVVSAWSHITATHLVEIGDGVLIGSKVIITDHNHGQYSGPHTSPAIPPNSRPLGCDNGVVIGLNVWLGDGVIVMPGVKIGNGSVIGANSVVTRDVPPFTIAAGVPAAALKMFDFTTQEWRKL
jgi:lipopolysaccharide O-acetyltransferase